MVQRLCYSEEAYVTVARSSAVCPSWFFMVGSAPWARSRAHNWVRPFCAASCSGVKAHLSVAFTQVLNLMSRAAMSTCYSRHETRTSPLALRPVISGGLMLASLTEQHANSYGTNITGLETKTGHIVLYQP